MVWTRLLLSVPPKKTLGFGTDVQRKRRTYISAILKDVVPEDLLKFGLDP